MSIYNLYKTMLNSKYSKLKTEFDKLLFVMIKVT